MLVELQFLLIEYQQSEPRTAISIFVSALSSQHKGCALGVHLMSLISGRECQAARSLPREVRIFENNMRQDVKTIAMSLRWIGGMHFTVGQ